MLILKQLSNYGRITCIDLFVHKKELTNLFCRIWSNITTTFVYDTINFSQSTTTCHLEALILKVRDSMVSTAANPSIGQDDLDLPVSI